MIYMTAEQAEELGAQDLPGAVILTEAEMQEHLRKLII